jgi:hypothetical protein
MTYDYRDGVLGPTPPPKATGVIQAPTEPVQPITYAWFPGLLRWLGSFFRRRPRRRQCLERITDL